MCIRNTMKDEYESVEDLQKVLCEHGFVPCTSPSCNCGSWHPRYGVSGLLIRVKDILADAGHPLSNSNEYSILLALQELVAERDSLKNHRLKNLPHDEEEM